MQTGIWYLASRIRLPVRINTNPAPGIAVTATAYVARRPWLDTKEVVVFRKDILRRLDQLRINLKMSHPGSFFGNCQIEVRDPDHAEIEYIKMNAKMGYAGQFFALDLISSDFDYDKLLSSVSTSDGSPLSDEDRHSVAQHGLCYEILNNLRAILSLWNICYLGCLSAPYLMSKFESSVLEAGEMCESRCLCS